MKIKSIIILTKLRSNDKVSLELDSTTAFPAMNYPAFATVECKPNYGITWVKENFDSNTPIKVVDCSTGKDITTDVF